MIDGEANECEGPPATQTLTPSCCATISPSTESKDQLDLLLLLLLLKGRGLCELLKILITPPAALDSQQIRGGSPSGGQQLQLDLDTADTSLQAGILLCREIFVVLFALVRYLDILDRMVTTASWIP